jgi:hypothetical protein
MKIFCEKQEGVYNLIIDNRKEANSVRHFFDPSLLPVTTTDIDGNILYVRTNGLHHYGYPDIIAEQGGEEAEQLLLDILDRIFCLDFNINATWNYNGKLFKLVTGTNGLAYVIYPDVDEARIITILNPVTGKPTKHKSKGLLELFDHPEAEVNGETLHGREILSYLIDQVKDGVIYDQNTIITYEMNVYEINYTADRLGTPIVEIHLQQELNDLPEKAKTHKRIAGGHLTRVK